MANKRMFSNDILNNDEFIEMPLEAQMLYIRLNMAADDRGICDGPRTVMRACGASNDSMKLLIAKKFVLIPACKPSVVVIKHWWINNNVSRKERFKETKHTDVMQELFYDGNKSYSQNPNDGHISCISNGRLIWPSDVPELIANMPFLPPMSDTRTATCQTVGYPTDSHVSDTRTAQVRLDKDRVGKDRVVESREDKNNNILSTSTSVRGKGESEGENPTDGLTDAEKESLNAYYGKSIGSYMRLGYDYDIIIDLAVKKGADREKVLEIARGGAAGG